MINNKVNRNNLLCFIILIIMSQSYVSCNNHTDNKSENQLVLDPLEALEPWKEGFLDIHHINTGRGDATFFILPDGTTMMFDIGAQEGGWADKPIASDELKVTPIFPNDSLRPGQWIANYIKQVIPPISNNKIDYAVISHFHIDHYGSIRENTKLSNTGAYKLSGVTDLFDIIPISKIIDRGFPNYDYPLDLKNYYKEKELTFVNYLDFVDYNIGNKKLIVESLRVGDSEQITLLNASDKYDFTVMPIKSNGTIKDSLSNESYEYMKKEDVITKEGKFGENPLCNVLKISYGDFDYYTGGDITGVKSKTRISGKAWWWDVETPVAKAVGQVEVATMNHHGVRDAMNDFFVKKLNPKIFVQQSITSDHPGQEAFYRIFDLEPVPDLFATNIHEVTLATYGRWFKKAYKSKNGHIVIRVLPGGKEFYVFILDHLNSILNVKDVFGPYQAYDN